MLGGTKKDPVLFIPGQMGEIMEKQVSSAAASWAASNLIR